MDRTEAKVLEDLRKLNHQSSSENLNKKSDKTDARNCNQKPSFSAMFFNSFISRGFYLK